MSDRLFDTGGPRTPTERAADRRRAKAAHVPLFEAPVVEAEPTVCPACAGDHELATCRWEALALKVLT